MDKKTIMYSILVTGLVISLFFIFFDYFGIEWWLAAFLAFILGEIVILVPIYVLFWQNLKK